MKNAKFKFLPGDEVWHVIDVEQDSFEIGHGRIFSCTTSGSSPEDRTYLICPFSEPGGFLSDNNIEIEECEVFDAPDQAIFHCLKAMKEFDKDIDAVTQEHPF